MHIPVNKINNMRYLSMIRSTNKHKNPHSAIDSVNAVKSKRLSNTYY